MKSVTLIFSLLFFASQALSYDAKISKLKGEAQVLRAKNFKLESAKLDMELFSGDLVRTQQGALVHLDMESGRIALIKENSRFKLISDQKKQHVSLEFDQGEFLVGLKQKLKKEESFSVRTPAAVVGVRGTLFWGLSDENMTSTYACFENQITILAAGIMLALNPGEKVVIPYGDRPQKVTPANVPLSYLDTFKLDGSLQDLEKLLE